MVSFVLSARQRLPRPGVRTRIVVGLLTVLALVPVLLRLPRVSVVACFGTGQPLYQWIPNLESGAAPQCVSAPTPVVSWTLVIAATLLVQLVLLPLLILAGAVLVRGSLRLIGSADRILLTALVQLAELVAPRRRLAPVPVRTSRPRDVVAGVNRRRGPPSPLF